MKRTFWLLLGIAAMGCVAATAAETNVLRIGIYDSRAVAYAWFGSATNQAALKTLVETARAAKKSGNVEKFNELEAALREKQANIHRQVFSTAPADDALAAIKERIPEIERQAGVNALVSKWDEKTLVYYRKTEKVDVTDQLVRQFIQPDQKQTKVIESFKRTKPLSLEKCNELIRQGKI